MTTAMPIDGAVICPLSTRIRKGREPKRLQGIDFHDPGGEKSEVCRAGHRLAPLKQELTAGHRWNCFLTQRLQLCFLNFFPSFIEN